jgi:alkylation response protein AidB-like acyl-CoA dehydrogenase
MDFWPSDDEYALQEGMRAFVSGRFSIDAITSIEETGSVIDIARWRELAEMGVFSLRADGLGMREAVLVFEELGRGLVPGPLVATHLAAGLVDGAGDGTCIVGMYEPTPTANLVEHGAQVQTLLWFAEGELRAVDPTSLGLQPIARPLDALSPVWNAVGEPVYETVAVGDTVGGLRRAGVVLTAALQLGLSLATVELATAFAMGREQFGRPIGSFQAVKHLLAEMLVKAEVARAAVYAAACELDGAGSGDASRAAAAAKVMAGEAALFCGRTGIQVHGGMGFTWEVHAQRYWKRAVVLDTHFGSAEEHAVAVAGLLTEGI